MKRKRVWQPIQSIEEVQASIYTYGSRVAVPLDLRRSTPVPDDGAGEGDGDGVVEPAFSYKDVFDDLGHDLESLRLKLIAADDEHVRRVIRAAELRRRSRELGRELHDEQVKVRQVIVTASDRDRAFELTAVSGQTPRNLKPLEEQADQTVKLLRKPAVAQTSVVLYGVEIALGNVADGLDASLGRYRTARRDLLRARKAMGESKVLLDRALAEVRGKFPWIAQAFEAFARMAGERELADRIRTSIRRVTRRQGEDEEPAGPASAEETSADEPSAEETSADEPSADEPSPGETASDPAASDERSGAPAVSS